MLHTTKQFKTLIDYIKTHELRDNSPLDICLQLIGQDKYINFNQSVSSFFCNMQLPEKYYWIGNIYTSLISDCLRRELSAFFTPPHLCVYIIDSLIHAGLNITSARILDPASGGAAFITPLSIAIIDRLKKNGRTDAEIGQHLRRNLNGIEIDKNLAILSEVMLKGILSDKLPEWNGKLSGIINNADALSLSTHANSFDLVISNPPYGRIKRPDTKIKSRFADILTNGHVNKYALFIKKSIDWAKPGGFIATVVPTSFIAGPNFENLRKAILGETNILAVDLIEKRDNVFLNVLQDACVLVLRKKTARKTRISPTCRLIVGDGAFKRLGEVNIPGEPSGHPWVMPSELCELSTRNYFSESFAALEDYGYGVRAGYFVWNRERERYSERVQPKAQEFPLIWGHCVKPNQPCSLATHRGWGAPSPHMSLVRFDNPSDALIKAPVVVLQRTSDKTQKRRLIAGYIQQEMIDRYGAVITENHTIIVYPLPDRKQLLSINDMCRLLNSRPVDLRFRQLSGTVSVSVKTLKLLPLPQPRSVKRKIKDNIGENDFDELIESCYRNTGE